MTEIYWLTRLDAVCIASLTVFLVCTIWGVASIVLSDYSIMDSIARIKWLIVTDVLALSILLFVPDTKDALVIYGLGSTKDWIENNEKTKEIPQKVIDALDKYLSEE